MVDVSVILVSYNTIEMTKTALNHLESSSHNLETEVFVIDNDSKDHSVEVLRNEYPNINLIENKSNVGFGRANNQALPNIKGRYVLLLNTDAFVETDTVAKTVQYMDANPCCGILGVRLIGRDGELQPSCRYFPTPWNLFLGRSGLKRFIRGAKLVDDMSWDHASVRDCDWVPGCYLLIRKEVIDEVGLFDPRYFLYYEEVDLCFAAKSAGWGVTYFPYTSVIHLGGESAKHQGEISTKSQQIESLKIESELLYFRKNHGLMGVLEHLLLDSLADFIQFAKDIVKARSPKKIIFNLRRAMFVWKMFFRTELATVATR
ncbi:MAG: glycosyltransferase family 2 protein [Gammaproteobacteria bacterium]|nr:glycosyltransferase family 2 protein [Gammaproteobacteria bacterium]MBU1969729.1 glycosyltransferase family 2 protein [Gammaproteobacteria bacterium]